MGYNRGNGSVKPPKRGVRTPRAEYIVNVVVFTGYAAVAAVASALKAWQTAGDLEAVGWLPKTNAIVWDTITLYAALGALALGVREMVLAYFMRKGTRRTWRFCCGARRRRWKSSRR